MANEIRVRSNNIGGSLAFQLASGTVGFSDASFVQLPTIDGVTNHLLITLDPLEANGAAEVIMVTNHAAASATITCIRGVENTTPRLHPAFTTWYHGPVVSDFTHIVTSGTRPAVPYEGELIYETDTNKLLGFGGTDWAPRDAGGTLGYAQVTANDSFTTLEDLTGLSVVVTVGSGRRVRVTGHFFFSSTVAVDTAAGLIREGAVTLQTIQTTMETAARAYTIEASVVLTPSAGSHTYKLSAERAAGTGTLTNNASATFPSFILVEDIGAV